MIQINLTEIVRNAVNVPNPEFISVWEWNYDRSKEKLPSRVSVDFIPYVIEFNFQMTTKKYFTALHGFYINTL